jgi:Glutathione S-transferase, N-terminal domain
MKLYICYGLFRSPRPGGHPCRNAHEALRQAGWQPEIQKSYGLGLAPDFLNQTPGRREVKRLTGNNWVPVLVLDNGDVVQGSDRIVSWAKNNPAAGAERAQQPR